MKKMSTSNWISLAGIVIIVVTNTWILSAKFSALIHRLDGMNEEIKELIIKLDANDTQDELTRNRVNKLEYRVDAVERKLKP